MFKEWNSLPQFMKNDAVRPYYNFLQKKRISLIIKRIFDFFLSTILLILFSPLFFVIAVLVLFDSRGGIFFRQERVTQYGRKFQIWKFRTMKTHTEEGALITVENDERITRVGYKLRKYHLDELPQLINVLFGDMSFVGTRPEVVKYVKQYTPEMMASLLLPAGITSECSIRYKEEGHLLELSQDIEKEYIQKILPEKMKFNLEYIRKFSLIQEMKIMIKTMIVLLTSIYKN